MSPVPHIDERRIPPRHIPVVRSVKRRIKPPHLSLNHPTLPRRQHRRPRRLEVEEGMIEVRYVVIGRRNAAAAACPARALNRLKAPRIVVRRLQDPVGPRRVKMPRHRHFRRHRIHPVHIDHPATRRTVGRKVTEIHPVLPTRWLFQQYRQPPVIGHAEVASGIEKQFHKTIPRSWKAAAARQFKGDRIMNERIVELRRVRTVENPVGIRRQPRQRHIAFPSIPFSPGLKRVTLLRKGERTRPAHLQPRPAPVEHWTAHDGLPFRCRKNRKRMRLHRHRSHRGPISIRTPRTHPWHRSRSMIAQNHQRQGRTERLHIRCHPQHATRRRCSMPFPGINVRHPQTDTRLHFQWTHECRGIKLRQRSIKRVARRSPRNLHRCRHHHLPAEYRRHIQSKSVLHAGLPIYIPYPGSRYREILRLTTRRLAVTAVGILPGIAEIRRHTAIGPHQLQNFASPIPQREIRMPRTRRINPVPSGGPDMHESARRHHHSRQHPLPRLRQIIAQRPSFRRHGLRGNIGQLDPVALLAVFIPQPTVVLGHEFRDAQPGSFRQHHQRRSRCPPTPAHIGSPAPVITRIRQPRRWNHQTGGLRPVQYLSVPVPLKFPGRPAETSRQRHCRSRRNSPRHRLQRCHRSGRRRRIADHKRHPVEIPITPAPA